MERFFNIAGPCNPAKHYMLPAMSRLPEAVAAACRYSGGQSYLANALARWCVEKIHGERYGETVTAADMHEAKEKIIRHVFWC